MLRTMVVMATCILVAGACSRHTGTVQAQAGPALQAQQGVEQAGPGASSAAAIPRDIQTIMDRFNLALSPHCSPACDGGPMLAPACDGSFSELHQRLWAEWKAADTVDAAIAWMRSENPFDRARGAARIGDLLSCWRNTEQWQRALPCLLAMMDDATPLDGIAVHPMRDRSTPVTPGEEAVRVLRHVPLADPTPIIAAFDDATSAHALANLARLLPKAGHTDAVIGRLIGALEHTSSDVRGAAAASIGSLGAAAALRPLLAIEPTTPTEAQNVCQALLALPSDEARAHVLTMLTDGADQQRWAACEALCQCWRCHALQSEEAAEWRDRAISGLVAALFHDPSAEVRLHIAARITDTDASDPRVAEALMQAVGDDADLRVRTTALHGLHPSESAYPDRRVGLVLQFIHATEPKLRMAAVGAASAILRERDAPVYAGRAAEIKLALIALFHDPDWQVRRYAVQAIGPVAGPEDADLLLAVLSDKHMPDREPSMEAALVLARIQGLGVDTLRKLDAALQNADPEQACAILTAIWGIVDGPCINVERRPEWHGARLDWWLKHRDEYLK